MSLIILLAQCVCMFIASFAVGSLPLMFKSAAQGKSLIHGEKEQRLTGRHETEGSFDAWNGTASRSGIDDHYTGVSLSLLY